MAEGNSSLVVYWDASAALSVLFTDIHSATAKKWVDERGFHLLSTLAYTETCAVISRLKREDILADVLIQAAYESVQKGPWRRLKAFPKWEEIQQLSLKWPLRGADLWHLATAKVIQNEFPELFLLTFDTRLSNAAQCEGLLNVQIT